MIKSKKIVWFLGTIFVLLIIFLPGYTKLQELRDKNKELEAKIDKVNSENELLKDQIARIDGDPIYQEEVIRDKLGVVRKGEVVYKIESEE